jgi:TPR repeat protein
MDQQDHVKAMELLTKAADLGNTKAHNNMACIYDEEGDMKKARFHFEAAAMLGHELARNNLGVLEANSGNMERAIKHWTIGASAGCFHAMYNLLIALRKGHVSRESIDSTLELTKVPVLRREAKQETLIYIRAKITPKKISIDSLFLVPIKLLYIFIVL